MKTTHIHCNNNERPNAYAKHMSDEQLTKRLGLQLYILKGASISA